MALFANAELFSEKLEQLSGVDAERMCDYQVIMTSGFQDVGLSPTITTWQV